MSGIAVTRAADRRKTTAAAALASAQTRARACPEDGAAAFCSTRPSVDRQIESPIPPIRGGAIESRLAVLEAAFAARTRGVLDASSDAETMLPDGPVARASVALVVRPERSDLELPVIKRATRSGDPWSGHLAFPGGRRSAMDASGRETAERETREEVGISLVRDGRLLGRLQDVWPRSGAPAIIVSPYAYAVDPDAAITLNHEVDAAIWIPLRKLAAPGAATEYLHALSSGEELRLPAIAYESHVIWGLTHRIMTEFLDIVRPAIAESEAQ